ncbi:MAG: hypothetical protein IPL95_18990 [Saprospiraceae bacterium]|nr:hypothetical protein [Saprospiraceae bacterium]
MKKILNIGFVFVAILYSCKSVIYTPSTLPSEKLVFGYGGGFNPKPVEFIMLKNGQMFTTGLSKDTLECIKINKSLAKAAFSSYYSAFNALKEPGTPGNTYRFIDLQKDSTSKKYVWNNKQFDKNIDSLYHVFKKLVELPVIKEDSIIKN